MVDISKYQEFLRQPPVSVGAREKGKRKHPDLQRPNQGNGKIECRGGADVKWKKTTMPESSVGEEGGYIKQKKGKGQNVMTKEG